MLTSFGIHLACVADSFVTRSAATQASIHRAELRPSLRTFAANFFTEEIEIKDTVAMMLFKLNSVFVSTGRDSDKPEKINISILSGCCRL